MIGLKSDANGNSRAHMSTSEQTILAIWEEVLQRKNIGTKDDFFDVGGTSLALMRIFAAVNQHFNIDLDSVCCRKRRPLPNLRVASTSNYRTVEFKLRGKVMRGYSSPQATISFHP